jgi:hypothetical protein
MNSSFDNTPSSTIKSPRKANRQPKQFVYGNEADLNTGTFENTELATEDAELEWDFNHHQESGERLRDVGGR